MINLIDKLKDPILVSSVLSTIFLVLSGLDIIQITDNNISLIVNSIMSILSVIGVINSPQAKNNKINESKDDIKSNSSNSK